MFNIYNAMLAGAFALFVLWDAVAPARTFYQPRAWKLKGLLSALVYFALASYSPYLWAEWMGQYRLVDATGLSLWLAVPLGYAVLQLLSYLWHRCMHASDFLWRTFHQMHHSAERMDIYGALYFHPFDTIGFTFVGSLALTVIIGLDPLAAAYVGVFGGIAVLFTHANIRTPRWIGYVMARPEGHALHHERGRHAGNYGELVIWDMLFGSYENPQVWEGEAGFYDGASARVGDMLMFQDVSHPKAEQTVAATPDYDTGTAPSLG